MTLPRLPPAPKHSAPSVDEALPAAWSPRPPTPWAVFESPDYLHTLSWLGTPVGSGNVVAVARPWGAEWDLRGSWPYQSTPDAAALTALSTADSKQTAPFLSFTAVLRPDLPAAQLEARLTELRERFSLTCRPLKPHLCHDPSAPSPRQRYSPRTRKRLLHANTCFTVAREALGPQHRVVAQWQAALGRLRRIPRISLPDAAHLHGLMELSRAGRLRVQVIALRWRTTHALAGALLALPCPQTVGDKPSTHPRPSELEGDGGATSSTWEAQKPTPTSWHAHSLLVEPAALAQHGGLLLFDRALDLLGDAPLWVGGEPAGANGAGVFRFKSRFANHEAPAHLLSVDLAPEALLRVRREHPRFAWLPDYRDPEKELAVD